MKEQKQADTGIKSQTQAGTDVLDVEEAAQYLKFSPRKLYGLVRNGEIPHKRIGRQYRFSRRALDAWLSNTPVELLEHWRKSALLNQIPSDPKERDAYFNRIAQHMREAIERGAYVWLTPRHVCVHLDKL